MGSKMWHNVGHTFFILGLGYLTRDIFSQLQWLDSQGGLGW